MKGLSVQGNRKQCNSPETQYVPVLYNSIFKINSFNEKSHVLIL